MVKKYGMNSSDWGYMVVDDGIELDHKIGSNTRDKLDTASQKVVEISEKRVRAILTENINKLKELAQKLCEYEELNKQDIDAILSGKNLENENEKKEAKRKFSISSIAI
jgi:ATP-dependent Zn protease